MALSPNNFTLKDRLQPGARGETFQVDMPGYRAGEDRVNRTNMRLAVSQHDVPNTKYQFDYRLPVLFRFGFAYGYNQVVLPKGRVVALDPNMNWIDTDMKHAHNVLTLANGGVPVRLRQTGDVYKDSSLSTTAVVSPASQGQEVKGIGTQWIPLIGMDNAYEATCYRPCKVALPKAQLATAGYSVESKTGKVKVTTGAAVDNVRVGNIPVGVIQRNEYTRDDDAWNGIMPGPVLTDALLDLPWFAYKDKAEQNPWGSSYGNLFPGALVKSDENGRITVSPLSDEALVSAMNMGEYEMERQQVIGQIYSIDNSLLPEGAAKWATWTLEERNNFEDMNPTVYPQTNRRGEDAVSNSPFNSNGEYPGYPYDAAYKNSDLHMLGGLGRQGNYDPRMQAEYQYDNLGIPGLTDGYNVATRAYGPITAGKINAAEGADYVDLFFRTTEVSLEANSLQISIGNSAYTPCTVGAVLNAGPTVAVANQFIKVAYADEKQGIVQLTVTDKAKADTFLVAGAIDVAFKFNKRGLAGVPTFLDWDGCVGSAQILLTK